MSAVESSRLSSILGYELVKGTASVSSGILPQRLAILGERNTDKTSAPSKLNATSVTQVADAYGFGSPMHLMALILDASGVLGKIETVFYLVAEAAGATARVQPITVTGTPTKASTQYIRIGGKRLNYSVLTTDDADAILGKIKTAIEAWSDSPVTVGMVAAGSVDLTLKWKGETGQDLSVGFDQDTDIGLTYALGVETAGTGGTSPAAALANFSTDWNTVVVNGLAVNSTNLNAYEAFIGNPTDKTGRYDSEEWKPCVAVSGSTLATVSALTALTDARDEQVANVVMSCGDSLSMPCEIAAAAAGLAALGMNSDRKFDMIGKKLGGIVPPIDLAIGELSEYPNRDLAVKGGSSTAKLNGSQYEVIDFVTTYHPDGENPAQFRYVRNLVGIDYNVKFSVRFNEELFLKGKTILPDSNPSQADNVIKPKQWLAILNNNVFKVFENDGAFGEVGYSLENAVIEINSSNPDRIDTEFPYKRSGTVRISSVSGVANFTLGG